MKKIILTATLCSLLTGCTLIFDIGGQVASNILNGGNNDISKTPDEYISISGSVDKVGLQGIEYLDYYSDMTNCEFLGSVGKQKILVVPVMFKGDSESNLSKSSSTIFKDLNTAFNGTSEETGWESVSSYYQKSSYGKLDIDATIYNSWIRLDKTYSEFARLDLNVYLDPTWWVLDNVISKLKNSNYNLDEYDTDKDGFIDGIWLIYGRNNYLNVSRPTSTDENYLWAYTYWQNNNSPVVGNPKANVYCWGSYDFMYQNVNSKLKIDAHTYIHETGHMLGLDDYYDYDNKSNPSGCLDMMDFNIGDHNAFSKYLLGWIEPKVFNFKENVFTLKPFESSGDFILIPTSKDNNISTMDEYLLIEFYTPTGLNAFDATYNYLNSYPKMFTKAGVKIYHIDARIGKVIYDYDYSDWVYDKYVYNYSKEDLYSNSSSTSYFSIFASNTGSYSYDEDYNLLRLISNYKGAAYEYKDTYAQNRDLFSAGDKFSNFKFNNGKSFDFSIEIDAISNGEAKVYIG